jgi:hypothetical protein
MAAEGHYRQIAEVQLYGDDVARDAEGRSASHMDRVQNEQAVAADVAEAYVPAPEGTVEGVAPLSEQT